jgi:hypothetical protein
MFPVALAFVLQSSMCHAHFCSGDACDDDKEDDGSQTEMIVLPPLRDPLGRPVTDVILVPVRRSFGSER